MRFSNWWHVAWNRLQSPTCWAHASFTRSTSTPDPQALVPRPETELLVELALEYLPPQQAHRVCDLGTGTGIIAITLKKQRPMAQVYATDVDPACVELARENARQHAVDIEWIESDWYRDLPAALQFDLIVSNPPYIAADHPFPGAG